MVFAFDIFQECNCRYFVMNALQLYAGMNIVRYNMSNVTTEYSDRNQSEM